MSSEGPAPLHVGSVSVGVASVRARGFLWLKRKRGPTCATHLRWTLFSALTFVGTACFFAGQLSSLGRGEALEDRCACSETVEVSAQFTLQQDEPRVWWYAYLGTLLFALTGGLLCGGFAAGAIRVAWWQRFTGRPEHPFVREAIPLRVNGNALRR